MSDFGWLVNDNGAVNERNWRVRLNSAGDLVIEAWDDALTTCESAKLTRTGTAVAVILAGKFAE